MTILLTIYLVALALLCWVCLFVFLPACSRSAFRNRVWRLRDDVVDQLMRGEYENREQPMRLVRDAEAAIRFAPEISLLNFWLMHRAARAAAPPARDLLDLEVLGTEDRR